MDEKRRLTIIIASVAFGTLLSLSLFMLRRGGPSNITANDVTALATNFSFALAIVVVVGIVFMKNKKKDKKNL